MSIEHFTAAFNCKLLKMVRAYCSWRLLTGRRTASLARTVETLNYGWSYAGVGRLMADINASSRDTVIDNMKVLVGCRGGKAGA